MNDLLKFNIKGNLGIVQIILRKKEGEKNVQEALISMKALKGINFYDYVFLN